MRQRSRAVDEVESEQARGARAVAKAREHFKGLRDPRRRRGKRHVLIDVVLISLLGMLCGYDDADDIADWAELHEELLAEWFGLEHGTPSQDTVLRVFELLSPKTFEAAVRSWLEALRGGSAGHIAIDGKTLRGSIVHGSEKTGVHVVSAFLRESGLVLGQTKTADKSNELTAIPRLLELIDVSGCVVTIDAAGCQRSIAEQILDAGGHYVLAVKDNQPKLREDLERLFAASTKRRSAEDLAPPIVKHTTETDAGHGRIEERTVHVSSSVEWLDEAANWPGVAAVAKVEARRTHERTGKVEQHVRYFISSDASMGPEQMLRAVRGHWSVENQLHWVLDVVMGEDASRIRARRAAENFGALRRLTLSMLRAAPPPKKKRLSLRARRRVCDHRPEYLLRVLGAKV